MTPELTLAWYAIFIGLYYGAIIASAGLAAYFMWLGGGEW